MRYKRRRGPAQNADPRAEHTCMLSSSNRFCRNVTAPVRKLGLHDRVRPCFPGTAPDSFKEERAQTRTMSFGSEHQGTSVHTPTIGVKTNGVADVSIAVKDSQAQRAIAPTAALWLVQGGRHPMPAASALRGTGAITITELLQWAKRGRRGTDGSTLT